MLVRNRVAKTNGMIRLGAKSLLTLAFAGACLFSLTVTVNASQPLSEGCCPPGTPDNSPHYSRYYGAVSAYPIGYYSHPVYYGYPTVTVNREIGYYPYAMPAVGYGLPAPYALGYYGGYYGYRGWPYSGYFGWGPFYSPGWWF
jgi:hypothetical protein